MPPRKKNNKKKAKPKKQGKSQPTKSIQVRLDEFRRKESGKDDNQKEYASYHQMWIDNFLLKEEINSEISSPQEKNTEKKDQETEEGSNSNEENDKKNEEEGNLDESSWYGKSSQYWEQVDATVNGMLGGFEIISNVDIKGSFIFLDYFLHGNASIKLPEKPTAIDVGAGIGRITKLLLSKLCSKVDILEQSQKFLDEAKVYLHDSQSVIGQYLCSPMQEFEFNQKYDIIWVQWVIIYLTDEHFIQFFEKCKNALSEKGIIVVKDNVLHKGFSLDTQDSSVTRSDQHLKLLFEASGLKIVKEEVQKNFPQFLFPVKMYALNKLI